MKFNIFSKKKYYEENENEKEELNYAPFTTTNEKIKSY